MQRILLRSSITAILTTAVVLTSSSSSSAAASNNIYNNFKSYSDKKGQPSFSATINLTREPKKTDEELNISLDSISLITGSAYRQLAQEIASIMNVSIAEAEISRFSDGEVNITIDQDLSGKDVYIIQTCAAPVNDSIMELLLTVSCARRAGASRIVAVIPYFAYKHHRRGAHLSTKHQSRFLTSNAKDFAKMLKEMGVDRVIAVDLQRPGQGQEACFFDSSVPLETLITTDLLISNYLDNNVLIPPIVVTTPSAESLKKCRKFQIALQKKYGEDQVKLCYFTSGTTSGFTDPNTLDMMGDVNIKGTDVLIVDDIIDTGGTISNLSNKFHVAGANNIYVCASHGLFNSKSSELIEKSHVKEVIVGGTLPLPKNASSKIRQISIAPLLSQIILAEHFRTTSQIEENYNDDTNI